MLSNTSAIINTSSGTGNTFTKLSTKVSIKNPEYLLNKNGAPSCIKYYR